MSAGLADFSIKLSPSGDFVLLLNGNDVSSSISEFSMQCRPGQPPVVSLFQMGKPGEISGEGIVKVISDTPDVVSPLEFIDSVDVQKLSDEVLKSSSFADDPIETAVDILRRWASRVSVR